MSSKSKAALVPKLRFPEFRSAAEWVEHRLDELAHYENGKAHENDISENGRYIVVNSKFISTEGTVRKFSNEGFCVADKRDILMVLSDVPNGRAIAKCFFVESDDLYTVNQRVCRIQPTKVNGKFLFYVLDKNSYFLDFDDGVKQTNLRKEDVVGFSLSVPEQIDEQQKIASCLSSLDDLIAAQARKVEALKTHKKGLMQQLFPREGETQPRLRFPEFRDTGEWNADSLAVVADFVNEKIALGRVALENYVSTENILVDFGGVDRASKLPTTGSVTRFQLNDTLVSNIRPYLKKVWVANKEGGASNDVIVIRAKQKLLPKYLSTLLKNDAFIDYVMVGAKGVKMPRGDISSMKAYPALYPSKPEQKRIADCLASFDNLITAATLELETLKTHKKGLMQQLFPSVEVVEA